MRAMVLHGANQPFVMEERPDPVAGPGESVARIITCGAGLTIHHVKAGRTPANYPVIIGHEITGEIVETGQGVTDLKVGDPVTVWFYLTCGGCKWCRTGRETLCENFAGFVGRDIDGCYAEYVKLPARNYLKLPEGLDYASHPAEIGVITDALATPYKVISRARVKPLERVAVFGAGGGLGVHMVMMARWAGARVIAVDIAREKLSVCRQHGADDVVDASAGDPVAQIMEITKGKGIDVAIDFVSSKQTLEQASQALGIGGRLVTLGGSGQVFEANSRTMLMKELELIGSRYATRQEVTETLDLVARGELWPLVTEIYRLEEAEKVHTRLEKGLVTGRAVLRVA